MGASLYSAMGCVLNQLVPIRFRSLKVLTGFETQGTSRPLDLE